MKKTRNHSKYTQPFAWLDLVFNIMMSFAFLFVLSYILINVSKKNQDMNKPKAEILVTMTWPDYAVDDLDLWLQLPDGKTISFTHKEEALIGLERDDLGVMSNQAVDEAGVVRVVATRKEIITFRALPVGRYQVSVHYYSSRGGPEVAAQLPIPQPVPAPPYPVKVEITLLNPTVKMVFNKDVIVSHVGEETTVVSFEIDTDGTVRDFKTENLEKFIPIQTGMNPSNNFDGGP